MVNDQVGSVLTPQRIIPLNSELIKPNYVQQYVTFISPDLFGEEIESVLSPLVNVLQHFIKHALFLGRFVHIYKGAVKYLSNQGIKFSRRPLQFISLPRVYGSRTPIRSVILQETNRKAREAVSKDEKCSDSVSHYS